jgi:low affinity Fe/Cu permease
MGVAPQVFLGRGPFAAWCAGEGQSSRGFKRRPEPSLVCYVSALLQPSPMETRTMELIRRSLTNLGVLAGHPLAFLIVVIYGLAWLLLDRENFGWHGFAVLATWFMTLLIQRAEYRDTQAIQAKLDELLHAQTRARNGLTHIDEEEPEDIERHRALARQND